MVTYGYLIKQLNRFNLAYLHFVEGATGGTRELLGGADLDALRVLFAGGPTSATTATTLS